MKLGWNLETGLERSISSWKSDDDPARGDYSVKFDHRGYPQLVYMKGSVVRIRKGSWNGVAFTGFPSLKLNQVFRYEFVMNNKEVYFEYESLDRSFFSLLRLIPSGFRQRLIWTSRSRNTQVIESGGPDQCEIYTFCGANSICSMDGNSPTCECLKGFVPKFPDQWNLSY